VLAKNTAYWGSTLGYVSHGYLNLFPTYSSVISSASQIRAQSNTPSKRGDRYDAQLPLTTINWFEDMRAAHQSVSFCVQSTWPTGEAARLTGREKREREFSMGRRCAAQLLADQGIVDPVEVNRDRSPAWPAQSVGSISHSDRWTIACVAGSAAVRSVGIDTEPVMVPETENLVEQHVATADEMQLLTPLGFETSAALTLIFSAKESFYKCWYPITKQFLEFKDVQVVGATDSSLSLRRVAPSLWDESGEESEIAVHYHVSENEVFTFAILEGNQ